VCQFPGKSMDEDLRLFIRATIGSVWALEILLFLRARPGRPFTRDEVARELRSNSTLVSQVFAALETAGLLAAESEGHAYRPASAAMDQLCARLEASYRTSPVAVVNAIVSARRDSVQSFADAFRIKGERKP
jgi:hypothetical protein